MCTDTDTATDPDTDTFILIGPHSDLCCTVRVTGWACLSFCVTSCAFSRHFLLPLEKRVWSSHAIDQQNHEGRNRAADRTGPRECCSLRTKVLMITAVLLPSNRRPTMVSKELVPWLMQGKRERNAQPSVCINTTKNVRHSVCHHVPIVCFCRTPYNACRIRIRTTGLAPSGSTQIQHL